ncbi:GNAT family N-acetyltransferase [Thalassospira sp. MA62]|nr:GNAT family N-acetyltransferase [Thalassospira sp. MA62]
MTKLSADPSSDQPPSDAIEIVALTSAFVPLAAALHAKGFDDPWDADAIERLLDVPGAFGLLAFIPADVHANRDDIPVGFVLIQSVLDEGEITTITVLPDHRGSGIGKKLLHAVMDRLKRSDGKRLLLEVAIDNAPAIALYQGIGFTEIGRRRGYYGRQNGQKVDAIVLERLL